MPSKNEAYAKLPDTAYWSCSFGNPGEGGFTEYYRTPNGVRFTITNGPYYLHPSQFDWHCTMLDENGNRSIFDDVDE